MAVCLTSRISTFGGKGGPQLLKAIFYHCGPPNTRTHFYPEQNSCVRELLTQWPPGPSDGHCEQVLGGCPWRSLSLVPPPKMLSGFTTPNHSLRERGAKEHSAEHLRGRPAQCLSGRLWLHFLSCSSCRCGPCALAPPHGGAFLFAQGELCSCKAVMSSVLGTQQVT